MNGHSRQFSSSSMTNDPIYGAGQHAQIGVSSQTLLNGYRDTLQSVDGYGDTRSSKRSRSRSSGPLDSHDPVSMHLLMETAMGESQNYDILSIEGLEQLKKELDLLSSRIDATKRKLVLENKIRDAAQSFNRLDTPNNRDSVRDGFGRSPKGHRRSILGSRGSMSDLLNPNGDELAASTKKCEELAQELWKLEKRMQELQRRLLEHTAGVLQVTHTGFLKDQTPPHTPDAFSHYTTSHDHESPGKAFYDFDDRSFYQTLDSLLEPGANSDGARGFPSHSFAKQSQAISDTERRLESLTNRLRAAISEVSGKGDVASELPPINSDSEDAPEVSIQSHLDHLEKGIDVMQRNQNAAIEVLKGETRELVSKSALHEDRAGQYEANLMGLWNVLASGQDQSRQGLSQRDSSGSDDSRSSFKSNEPFSLERFTHRVRSLHSKNAHLREQKDILTRQVQQQRELNGKSDAEKDFQISDLTTELERVHVALEAKHNEAKESRDELVLVTQYLDTARQEATLQEQQREKSARDVLETERQARREAEEQLVSDLEARQKALHSLEAELADTKDDHGIARAAMRAELEESEKRVQQSIAQVEAAKEAKAHQDALELSLRQQIEEKTGEAEKAHEEMQSLEGEMVRLHTELTVAKAELDGAYGTRAQRAAEMAANPAVQKEIEELNERNARLIEEVASLRDRQESSERERAESDRRIKTLQQELSETIAEFESMTKASIEFEKEREALESMVDRMRDRSEEAENQLAEERLNGMGVKSSTTAGKRDSSVPGSTSANVLKNEFRKMMRETRAENMKALRFEQEERRKLEALIRTMKKDQTPGKSSLNQSITAA
ncbi:MAG: hypothetical protein Q9169_000177 [Polycauliona sp. 2 TL-2023]